MHYGSFISSETYLSKSSGLTTFTREMADDGRDVAWKGFGWP